MQYFTLSILSTLAGFLVAYFYIGGMHALYIVFLLSILEISVSFDNAVVNAKVLRTMEEKWQDRFITYGIPIAVFGMRFLFPIIIVAIAGNKGIYETFNMAVYNPTQYQTTLDSINHLIYAFGGAFLLMVFLDFLFDHSRKIKWIEFIENSIFIRRMIHAENIETIIATTIGLFLIHKLGDVHIALAYFTGVLLHSVIITLDNLLNTNGIRSGIIGLLYLEVLDASFSFDGVIGAFALSSNIFIIMIGLGIGAMFVRSLTLYMVKKKTLEEYHYLEHGAHYAILALALIMFAKMFTHINEIIVGTIGIGFIALAVVHSIYEDKKRKNRL